MRRKSKIDLDVHAQRPVMVEGRSWETDILIDDLRIYGTAVWPETLEIESAVTTLPFRTRCGPRS